MLCTQINVDGKLIQELLGSERRFAVIDDSRFVGTEENEIFDKVRGGIPISWKNPLKDIPDNQKPFFDIIYYPTKRWEKNYHKTEMLVNSLFSDTYANKGNLNRSLREFLHAPQRDAPFRIEGSAGKGKSWFVCNRLMQLYQNKFDVIVLQLNNFMKKGLSENELELKIHMTIDEYFEENLKLPEWYIEPETKKRKVDFPLLDDITIQEQLLQNYYALSVIEKNNLRFRYICNKNSNYNKKLILFFDNIDHYPQHLQEQIVQLCQSFIGDHRSIKMIIAHRSSTTYLKSILSATFADGGGLHVSLSSPKIFDVLDRRFSTNFEGGRINNELPIPGSSFSYKDILSKYKSSNTIFGTASLLHDMCSLSPASAEFKTFGKDNNGTIDIRHYLRLFKCIIESDKLDGFRHINHQYYAIHALMLPFTDKHRERYSYLFNLFDNREPEKVGNALIRYRILEYFLKYHIIDSAFFYSYFFALGYSDTRVLAIYETFKEAALIEEEIDEKDGERRGFLTIAGKRHIEVCMNLWYIICIKTGMNIYKKYIRTGDEAIEKAIEYMGRTKVDFYSKHGWISEDDFINFIYSEECLERERITKHFDINSGIDLRTPFDSLDRIHLMLFHEVEIQKFYWNNHKGRKKV